jgi:hypothetical protein
MNIKNSITFEPEHKHNIALRIVDEFLDEIANAIPEDNDLVVRMTDEHITKADIYFVKDFLLTMKNNSTFYVEPSNDLAAPFGSVTVGEERAHYINHDNEETEGSHYKMVDQMINELRHQYPYEHITPIFCGAYLVAEHLDSGNIDFGEIAEYMAQAGESAHFFGWHDGALGAMSTFCNMLCIDPALVEASLCVRLEELTEDIEKGLKVSKMIHDTRY